MVSTVITVLAGLMLFLAITIFYLAPVVVLWVGSIASYVTGKLNGNDCFGDCILSFVPIYNYVYLKKKLKEWDI